MRLARRCLTLATPIAMLLWACAQPTEVIPATTADDLAKGRELFATQCALCHGEDGMGTNQGPPLVHEIYEPSHHSDLSFWLAVQNGVPAHHWDFGPMPPIPALTKADVAEITAYVRSLQELAGIR